MGEYFIIVPPVSPWDKKHETQIMIDMGIGTMGRTAGEAWTKHTRNDPSKVQHWHDRGYRLRRVSVELIPEKDHPHD